MGVRYERRCLLDRRWPLRVVGVAILIHIASASINSPSAEKGNDHPFIRVHLVVRLTGRRNGKNCGIGPKGQYGSFARSWA